MKNLGLAESRMRSTISTTRMATERTWWCAPAGDRRRSELSELVRSLDSELPLTESVLAAKFDDSLDDPRRWTVMLGAFAAVGMASRRWGSSGMSYVVRQRRREIEFGWRWAPSRPRSPD